MIKGTKEVAVKLTCNWAARSTLILENDVNLICSSFNLGNKPSPFEVEAMVDSLSYKLVRCRHSIYFPFTLQKVIVYIIIPVRYYVYKIQKHFQNVMLVGMASEISKNYTYKCVDRSRHNRIKCAKAKCAH